VDLSISTNRSRIFFFKSEAMNLYYGVCAPNGFCQGLELGPTGILEEIYSLHSTFLDWVLCLFIFVVLGLELRALSHSTSPFRV
jgi:hypothetical protein